MEVEKEIEKLERAILELRAQGEKSKIKPLKKRIAALKLQLSSSKGGKGSNENKSG